MQRNVAASRKRYPGAGSFVSVALIVLWTVLMTPMAGRAQGPALTTVSDTVYRADGTAAEGTVLISWPSFQTAAGNVVAAGKQSITIGPGGAFSAQLAANAGANPQGTYYVVIYQLDDGTVRTEYWSVPTNSPVTIAAVRTTPGTGLANTVATRAYVDQAVANVGSGSYVSKAGDTMTGPLTLPGPPTAPAQAADRQYVDTGLAAKADLVNGMVPPGELGAGIASSATCLTGNSTWGPCGGGAPAGITYATTALNWTQSLSTALIGGTPVTVTLSPCPAGIDTTSGAGYQVLIAGGGNSEAVNVAAAPGSCTPGAASGTIQFTPFYSYPAGSTVGSASSGIQETLNAACGSDPTSSKNAQCNITIPANGPGYPTHLLNTYNVAGTIYLHANQSILSGYGVSLNCMGRGPCLQIGDLVSSSDYTSNTVAGLSFRTPTNLGSSAAFAGVAIAQTQRASQVVTITTATAHGFRPGDMVTILFTDNNAYWGDAIVTGVPNSTTFQYAHTGGDIAAQSTPGVVALAYTAVLDDALNTHLIDISYDKDGENGAFNNFFDLWDDENASIDHFNNNAIALNNNANWTGSFVFSGGNQGASHQLAPVITLRDSTITANYSNGLTVYNSNGLYIENTVLQATGPWQVYSSNSTGNYQGAYLKNIYSESGPQMNPLTPAHSPFAGTGVAGLIAGPSSGAATFAVAGNGGPQGWFATGGSGSVNYSYFVVARDTTAGTQTSPLQVMNYSSTGSDAITVRWPRVANGTDVIKYDLLRIATPSGVGGIYPYNGGCSGGSASACGSIATSLVQCSGLVCTYTDNGANVTNSYSVPQGTYAGNLTFWPGSIVTENKSVLIDAEVGSAVGVGLAGNPAQVANQCSLWGSASPGGYTECFASMTSANNGVPNQTATLMTDGGATGGGMFLSKGRLNFSTSPSATLQPHHIITLIDSQPGLTRSTWGYRPLASASDTWIGTDVTSNGVGLNLGQLAFGAPVAISNYISASGDGIHANWLERLTSTLKELNVPVKFDQSVSMSSLPDGCLNVVSGLISSTGAPCGSGGGGGSVSSVFGRTGAVVAATGDYTVTQVTGAAADSTVVHNTGNETINGTKTFSTGATVNGNLVVPQGAGYVPVAGGLGLDTRAGLPVVNMNGTVQQVAFTSSNISGQAGTALALASVPTQCSGAFATGIQANGNANCTTPNVIQLAETAQPAGIPNWGVFWFDAATHTPRVIDNNGSPIQLGLTNLFNSDPNGDPADNLEERNGAVAQNFRVYTTYSGTNSWDRISLGSEVASGTNYNVLRSEDATSGNAPSIGIHIGSTIKWFFGADGMLKPNSDNSYDIGTDSGQGMRSVFAKTSFNMYTSGRQDFEYPNDGTAGTGANLLAVYNSAGTGLQTASTGNIDGVVGVVSAGAGTTGKAVVTWAGYAACNFDAANPLAGDYVVASTTQAGKCHDTGSASRPTTVQVIGRIEAGGGVRVSLGPPAGGGGGGAVSSVFGRTGAVSAQSGDYTVGQVTGAAPLSSPTFTGVLTHPDGTMISSSGWAGSPTFLNNVTINGNLSVAGTISQTSTNPTQWSGKEWAGTTVTVPSGMDYSLGVGSDNALHCQLATGASCLASGGGAVSSVFGRTGAVAAQTGDYTAAQVTGAVTNTTTVNGHALSANVVVSASDISTGTLPHAQLPALVSGDIPNNAANTTGTAGGLTGTPGLPNGTTGSTQSAKDGSTKVATDAYADAEVPGTAVQYVVFVGYNSASQAVFPTVANTAAVYSFELPFAVTTSKVAYRTGATADNTANTYEVGIYNASGALVLSYQAAGTSFAPATSTWFRQSWSQGATTLAPGRYYEAITTNCASSCATFWGSASTTAAYYSNSALGVTAGGTLPASITAPGSGFESFGANTLSIILE